MPKSMETAKGCCPIPVTPFNENLDVDWDDLERVVEFCVQTGAPMVSGPIMASEFQYLSEDERYQFMKVCADVIGGRTVYIAGVSAPNARTAAQYAEYAQKVGADCVVAMMSGGAPKFEVLYHFFKAISDAVTIPVMVQSAAQCPVKTDDAVKLCTEIENVHYVKEETPPSWTNIAKLNDRQSPFVKGIYAGHGGHEDPLDFKRGARGSIVAAYLSDMETKVWEYMLSGDMDAAYKLHSALLPAKSLSVLKCNKEFLKRRGVIRNTYFRSDFNPLDRHDMEDIDLAYKYVEPYFIWRGFSR